ncbi:MAG: Protease HtpX [Candidatus Lokiarchaeum sp. GC14_75]|nr:MAG: Protease HtpX [Candidatus Lokiarchaeum sp. GC14_75]
MKSSRRLFLFIVYIFSAVALFFILLILLSQTAWLQLITDWSFILTILLYLLTIEEFYQWVKNGKRSEMSDIVAILFFFFLIFFFSKDVLTSLMGAFSIYLWIGIFELRDYPILNKILIISLVTYNIIFIAGIFSTFLNNSRILDTTFAFSFWIILILGFILFGRKYLIVWRFLSPEYLMLFIYIIAWLAVVIINQVAPIFETSSPLRSGEFKIIDFFLNIYFILILVNWVIYFISGPILNKLLGITKIENVDLIKIVNKVKKEIGIKGKVKIGFGKYPILNAMAYGSVFDKRIAIIAEDINQIPKDELKGIIAHELAHTKGKHTLILTFITTIDLIIRMILGIPATYYDYTFGNPTIPLFTFIVLNLSIYILLFIIVRILEGRADLRAKKAGFARELAKALYNLESFYASGREIGFNTMLLSKEKISNDNKILDYLNTASYLYGSMIKPSRVSLLGNLLNSHPPSYFRIAALLDDKLKPTKEAILPFICLKKSKQKKYGQLFEKSRQVFKVIANEKFKEYFQIDDIALLSNDLGRREIFKLDLNKDYIFRNKITDEIIFGQLIDVQFLDNICSRDQLIITNLKTHEKEYLESAFFLRNQIDLGETYYLKKDSPFILKGIQNEERNYIFLDQNNNQFQKPILKTKLPNSVALIKNLENNEVFFKNKGEISILKCVEVSKTDDFNKIEIILSEEDESLKEPELVSYNLKDLIIKPRYIYLPIRKDFQHRKSEVKVMKWLIGKKILTQIYLKKPVNNFEMGYIQSIDVKNNLKTKSESEEKRHVNLLKLINIFGKETLIPFQTIESIGFEFESVIIQKKSATSFTSRLGYKILKKLKPNKIIIT